MSKAFIAVIIAALQFWGASVSAQDNNGFLLVDKDVKDVYSYELFDPVKNETMKSPFGDRMHPYAAMAIINKKMFMVGSGKWALSLRNIRAATEQYQESVEKSLDVPFVSEDDSFIYLEKDMVTITDAQNADVVIIPNTLAYELESLVGVKWDECGNKYFQGRYSGSKACNKKRFLDNKFVKYLEKNLLSCINESLSNINRARSKSVYVIHNGTAGDARHQKTRSLHNAGFAIDVAIFKLVNSKGKSYEINYKAAVKNKSSWEFSFFKEMRLCYGKRLVDRDRGCIGHNSYANRINKIDYQGTIGWERSDHRKHLHFSLPFCSGPNKRKFSLL